MPDRIRGEREREAREFTRRRKREKLRRKMTSWKRKEKGNWKKGKPQTKKIAFQQTTFPFTSHQRLNLRHTRRSISFIIPPLADRLAKEQAVWEKKRLKRDYAKTWIIRYEKGEWNGRRKGEFDGSGAPRRERRVVVESPESLRGNRMEGVRGNSRREAVAVPEGRAVSTGGNNSNNKR